MVDRTKTSGVHAAHQTGTSELAGQTRLYFEQLQQRICEALENIDQGKKFSSDKWERAEGGGGLSRVLEGGTVFEKAGVNASTVFGKLPANIARKMDVEPAEFHATGVSLVIHPLSPMVPTVHANFRYFEHGEDAWFGGGVDLTPYYSYDEDNIHFHTTLKRACDIHDPALYSRFKQWCDQYFFVTHRNETRGIGGIFFDYVREDPVSFFPFVKSVGDCFLEAYLPIVRRRMLEAWGERERSWQLLRRGRYVEFNLIYDRGTTFGLETKGRIESILMSLPPLVQWRYDVHPEEGSREALLVDLLRNPREWIT